MNFAPYQDVDPQTTRALSPPPRNASTKSPPPQPFHKSQYNHAREVGNGDRPDRVAAISPPPSLPPPVSSPPPSQPAPNQSVGGGRDMDIFATSLPLRLDQEACLAYLLLPPAGGAFLLLFEHKSDYVRFHAWQSSLLFTFIFVFHVIFSFSKVISIMMLVGDLALIGVLAMHAYQDADTLDRWEVPVFGRMASSFVDNE